MIDKRKAQTGEQGFILPTVLAVLGLLTLLAITSSDTALLQQKMAFNMKQRLQAIQSADAGLKHAESRLLDQVSTHCTCSALQASPDQPPPDVCHELLAQHLPLASSHKISADTQQASATASKAWQKMPTPAPTGHADQHSATRYMINPVPLPLKDQTADDSVLLLFRLRAQAHEGPAQAMVQSQYQITFQYCGSRPPRGQRFAWHEVRL